MLACYGALITVAWTADEAVETIREARPQVIVTDLTRPGDDGRRAPAGPDRGVAPSMRISQNRIAMLKRGRRGGIVGLHRHLGTATPGAVALAAHVERTLDRWE